MIVLLPLKLKHAMFYKKYLCLTSNHLYDKRRCFFTAEQVCCYFPSAGAVKSLKQNNLICIFDSEELHGL